jgi:peptidoglycan/LPS O-acetylase OafA/YrhL
MGFALIPVIITADAFSKEPISSAGLDLLLVLFVARCVFNPQDAVGRFLNLRPMRFLGKLSYSLYLWQQLFFHRSFIPMFPLNVLGTTGIASASYFLLEKPFLKLRSSLRRKTPGPEALRDRAGRSEATLGLSIATVCEQREVAPVAPSPM